ncbi:S9 family peptidase [bacterium]|nr:S9 family peptidase [bacterium]
MKRAIKADDLYKFKEIGGFDLSNDGSKCIYSVSRTDRKTFKKYSDLFLKELPSGKTKKFTSGKYVDSGAKFSPCGHKIAFLSNREKEKLPQLYFIDVDGGEAKRITDIKGSILEYEWSPDGSRILLTVQLFDPETIQLIEDPKKKELGIRDRHIKRVLYKMDTMGYRQKERVHLWVLESKSGKLEQLTFGDIPDESSPAWSPDGKKIAYITNLTSDPDLDPNNDDIVIMSVSSRRKKVLKTPRGPKWAINFSQDGKELIYLGKPGLTDGWRNARLYKCSISGNFGVTDYSSKWDLDIGGWTINDLAGYSGSTKPVWDHKSGAVYFTVAKEGESHLYSFNIKSKEGPEQITVEKGVLIGFSMDSDASAMVYLFGNMTDPGELYFKKIEEDKAKRISSVNTTLMNSVDLGTIEETWFKGASRNPVQGWIIKPPDFDPKKKYPSILEIHGGPRVQYGNLFMHEFFFLASKGYIVYFSNPRGGSGYGEKHSKAIWNAWGTVDYDDLMAWTDRICQEKYIDSKRMGVTGGSYGGYMTNWIIGHTKRFKAAVTQRGVSNLISMYGSSDFNWCFQMEFGNVPPWENVDNYWEQSPMKHIGNAKTPTLVIHSEQDLRCAQEQGEQIFIALKKLGVDTEMVLFPAEPHGLSRGGRTDRRISRLEHILRWFEKYL